MQLQVALAKSETCYSADGDSPFHEANAAPVGVTSSSLAGASLLVELVMSKEGAKRRNHALRKIRKARCIDLEIKSAIEVIMDLLNSKSGYNIAWPSAATIGDRLKRSRWTAQWYIKAIRALGIFRCTQFSPDKLREYCKQKYGFCPKLDRCVTYAPNLYEVDLQHALWDEKKTLPKDIDREMGEIIRNIKQGRNKKTTSRLASNPDLQPKSIRLRSSSRYCLQEIQQRLRPVLDALRDDVASDDIFYGEEDLK